MTATIVNSTKNLGGRFFIVIWLVLLIAGAVFYVYVLPELVAAGFGNSTCWNYYVYLHRFALLSTLAYTATYYYRSMRVQRNRPALHDFFWKYFLLFFVAFLICLSIYSIDLIFLTPRMWARNVAYTVTDLPNDIFHKFLAWIMEAVSFIDLWGPVILASVLLVFDYWILRLVQRDRQTSPEEHELYRHTVIIVDLPVVISTVFIKAFFLFELKASACLLSAADLKSNLAYSFFGGAHAFQFFAFNTVFLLLLLRHRWPMARPSLN